MKNISNTLSLISVILITVWLASSFYGGMLIYAVMYWWLIIPCIIVYIVTLIKTIGEFTFNKPRILKVQTYAHIYGLVLITGSTLYDSELFKSKKLLSAILVDDLSSISINLRENKTFDTQISGIFGYSEEINGYYQLKNDTLIFLTPPYSNDFVPDTVLINHIDSAIYINRLSNGKFDQTKSFINYFRIDLNELSK